MSDLTPTNELDRAIQAMERSQAAMPELCRRLSEGELWFLVPFHPEVEGEMLEIQNGSPLPFAVLHDQEGEIVPVYSSFERLEEGLKKGRVPEHLYSAGSLPAVQLLEILGKVNLRAVLNKSCATGQIIVPANLMRDLADGTALQPLPPGETKRGRLKILDPADYPTDLVQTAFEFIRGHPQFRAAWVFDSSKLVTPPVKGRCFQFLFLMTPQDRVFFHDLNLALQSVREKSGDVGLGLLDETDAAYIAQMFRKAPPFYVAADYRPPEATQ